MWTIVSNTIVIFITVIGYTIKEIIHWLKNKIRKNIISDIEGNAPTRNQISTIKNLNPRMKLGSIQPEHQSRLASKTLIEESKEELNTNKKEASSQIAKDWTVIFYKSRYD